MVVLAQALVSQPKFVIIDELSLGLAPVVVQRLIPTIRDGRRVGHRGPAHRAVRHRGAGPLQRRLRDGGWADPVLRAAPRSCATTPAACTRRTCCARSPATRGATSRCPRARACPDRRMQRRCVRAAARARALRRHRPARRLLRARSSACAPATGRRWTSRATGSTPATRPACTSPTAPPTGLTRRPGCGAARCRRGCTVRARWITSPSAPRLRRPSRAAGRAPGSSRCATPVAGRRSASAVLQRPGRAAGRDQREVRMMPIATTPQVASGSPHHASVPRRPRRQPAAPPPPARCARGPAPGHHRRGASCARIEDEEIAKAVRDAARTSGCSRPPTASFAAARGTWTSSTSSAASRRSSRRHRGHFRNADGTVDFKPAAIAVNAPVSLEHTDLRRGLPFLQGLVTRASPPS